MRRGVAILVLMQLVLAFTRPCAAQFSRFGLSGRAVYDLALFRGSLYAATDTGVYVTTPADPGSGWSLLGLAGKRVRSVHPHDVGPLLWTITAGLEVPYDDTTTSRTWCLNPGTQQWDPTDDGMNRVEINSIHALDGFPSLAICGETFAGGQGKVYRHAASGGTWDLVLDIGIGQVNAIGTAGGMVMAGGETAIFAPFIARSFDKGETWETAFPDMAGDNACDALAFGRAGTVFAGMEGAVIQSSDAGATWHPAGLAGTPYYFYGLAVDSVDNTVFAGGASSTGAWGFYVLAAGQQPWLRFDPAWAACGIRSLALFTDRAQGTQTVFIGTEGDGALVYQQPVVSVQDHRGQPDAFACDSYPNPFNGETVMSVSMPSTGGTFGTVAGTGRGARVDGSRVTIDVYDLLGRQVGSIYDGPLGPGSHRFAWAPRGLASGVYVCRVTAAGNASPAGSVKLIKMLYLR